MKKGFTLIELLVVIAIIGVLSSIVIAGINQSRARGRDAKRMLDLRQVQTALELYYGSNNAYPIGTSFSTWDPNRWGTDSNITTLRLYNALVPTYITRLPTDPVNRECNGAGCPNYYLGDGAPADQAYYYQSNDGVNYTLGTNLERLGMTNVNERGNWQLHN